jgi:MFS family permease
VLVLVALLVRLKVEESPEFSTLRSRGEVRRLPLVDVLRRSPASVVLGMGITFAPSSLGYLLSVYLLSYGTGTAGVAPQTMLLAITAASVVYLVVACLTALVSDRIGPGRVFTLASVLGVLVPFAVFALVNTAAVAGVLLATALLGVVLGLMVAVQAVIVSAAFRADVRYTGSSLSYQLGAVLGGGLTPLASATILGITGSWTAIAGYIALLAAVSGIAVWFLPRVAETGDEEAVLLS